MTDTERAVVKTYVPQYQKDEWSDHADYLGMSHSEFVRCMVQAGREKFEPDSVEGGSPDATPGVDGLETRVLEVLRAKGVCTWDELIAELSENLEDRLEATLQSLQADNEVQHSGRRGGYTLVEDA